MNVVYALTNFKNASIKLEKNLKTKAHLPNKTMKKITTDCNLLKKGHVCLSFDVSYGNFSVLVRTRSSNGMVLSEELLCS